MKYSEHFDIRELVHPDIYNHPAIGDRCKDFIHPNAKYTLDDLRERVGPITINDWLFGGQYVDSGLRLPDGNVGAALSAHRFGVAFDLKFSDTTPQDVFYEVLNNQRAFPFISRLESVDHTPTWLHIEICTKRAGDIIIFNP